MRVSSLCHDGTDGIADEKADRVDSVDSVASDDSDEDSALQFVGEGCRWVWHRLG
jgi:hypothetical protein